MKDKIKENLEEVAQLCLMGLAIGGLIAGICLPIYIVNWIFS